VSSLPAEYSEVPTAALPRTELFAPVSEGLAKAESTVMAAPKGKEDDWLSAMSELVLKKNKLDPKDFVSWTAYHAERQSGELSLVSQITLMPLFMEPAHTPAMIMHAMRLVMKATEHLHPGQVPVITMD